MNDSENAIQESSQPSGIKPKKKSYKKFIIPLIVIALVLSSICGIVYAKKKFRDGPHGFMIEMLTKDLNLTENQKAQVERLKGEIKEKMEANKPDRTNDMDDLAIEFKKDQLDKNKLMELANKKDQNKEEMKEFMMDKLVEFHSILTPEQRSKVVENMKSMKDKFQDGMHKFKDKEDKRD
ncbi:MAG: Spy/CpxP family protein refolding chaperone [Ignavibacteria bacterium]